MDPIDIYHFDQRVQEKQASREADAHALVSGQKSREELRRENSLLPDSLCRGPIDFGRIGSVRHVR